MKIEREQRIEEIFMCFKEQIVNPEEYTKRDCEINLNYLAKNVNKIIGE